MQLTEQKIRSFRPEPGKKQRLFDGRGLYLEISPTGGTYWRWKYHYGGKERRLAVGVYLPPYSPDLNPIEKAWSKFKQLLRSAKVRTEQALDQAITEALQQISADNAKAWFRLTLNWVQL